MVRGIVHLILLVNIDLMFKPISSVSNVIIIAADIQNSIPAENLVKLKHSQQHLQNKLIKLIPYLNSPLPHLVCLSL